MWCLYGLKTGQPKKRVAMFDSEAQLRAYVQWATLSKATDGTKNFEQKTPLTGFKDFSYERCDDTGDDDLPHNPSPSML